MKLSKYILASLLCNIAICILVVKSVLVFFLRQGSGNMAVHGIDCFKFFTTDSNVLVAISSFVIVLFIAKGVKSEVHFPKWVLVFKFIGTVCVSLTLLTVLFFLGPTLGYDKMFSGNNLHLHLICPLLALVSFIFFESGKLTLKYSSLALIPIIIYGCLYFVQVVIVGKENGGWDDFYGFNNSGKWYISCVIMFVASFLIASTVLFLHNKMAHKS